MHQPKSFQPDCDIKVRDSALFVKHGSAFKSKYQHGMMHKVAPSRDGIIWKVVAKYRNDQENVDRFTTSAVRELVLIHSVDELDLMEKLGKMATVAYMKQNLNNKH